LEEKKSLSLEFKGFGRIDDNKIHKIGVNAWDSMVYSEAITFNYTKLVLKITKLYEKDPSGIV